MPIAECPKMSDKQTRAAAVLASGGTIADAATAADVDPRTVARWRQQPAFSEGVQAAISEAFGDAVAVLSHASGDAARYLADVAGGRVECDGGRVNSCRLVLTLGPAFRESVEFESRLAGLERAILEGNRVDAT